jgi:hypothetical protein
VVGRERIARDGARKPSAGNPLLELDGGRLFLERQIHSIGEEKNISSRFRDRA